jgi:hypothetical protein
MVDKDDYRRLAAVGLSENGKPSYLPDGASVKQFQIARRLMCRALGKRLPRAVA